MKEKGSIRYYGKPGWDKLVRADYHGSKEVPNGLPIPPKNPDPKIIIQNEQKTVAA